VWGESRSPLPFGQLGMLPLIIKMHEGHLHGIQPYGSLLMSNGGLDCRSGEMLATWYDVFVGACCHLWNTNLDLNEAKVLIYFSDLGMGQLRSLNDELILRLLGLLNGVDLANLAATCKAMYCYANHEELWRAFVLQVHNFDSHVPILSK
jgi:hypothetical protein